MSEDDTIEIRQTNEFEALHAIFGEALQDFREKSDSKLWKPLHLSIKLTPQQGSSGLKEIHAQVDLHIVCSENYPNEAPKITLENCKGISTLNVNELKNELDQKAKELIGEVMMFELAQHVQAFLHRHNKPGFKSFYEEMLMRQQEQELQLRQAKQIEKDRERQVMLTEIQRRQEILKAENKTRKERFSSDNSEEFDPTSYRRTSITNKKSNSYLEYSDDSSVDCLCEHKTATIEFVNNQFREIKRGRCINHSHRNCTVFSGMDLETGELFVLSEWIVNIKNSTDLMQIQKQVSSIEQEMNYLLKLKHKNLAHYVNMKYDVNADENKVIIYTLRNFIFGLNSSVFLNEVPVETDLIRHISAGVLSALEFLHRNNVVHKQITDSCVYIDRKGVVKVANYSLDKRLSDLVSSSSSNFFNKKTDVYNFGILILSLVKGLKVSEDNADIPTVMSPHLYDFLIKCLNKNEKDRYTTTQLLNHPFIHGTEEQNSPQRNVEESVAPRDVSPDPAQSDLKMFSRSNFAGQSRVQSEFEVMQFIGKGAFGDVLKVRNKLDGGYYAIKRIELNPKNKQLNKKITREVKLLSKLNHENVVRYYNAWIESAIIDDDYTDTSKTSSSDIVPKVIHRKELTFNNDVELLAPPIKDVEWSISYESKSKAGPISSSSDDDSSDEEDIWGRRLMVNSSDSESIEFEKDEADETNSTISNPSTPSTNQVTFESVSPHAREIQFMYIQMEFCEKSTLRTAIDGGLHLDMARVWRLFREIIEGLAHIHQQGMIHRDLKPVNIFLDSNDHVKIGDFGLATTNILSRQGDFGIINKSMQEHDVPGQSLTGQIGTALYTAPELDSTTKTIYNQKVDLYSLGIIFFEMCYIPLNTQMERMKVLTGLRTSEIVFPSDFKETYRKQETLIRWLLNHDTSQRPTSHELLQSELIPPPILEEAKLREMFGHTLKNPQLKAYKYLIASCFDQIVQPAQDITYDMSLPTTGPTKPLQIFDYVKETVVKVFKLHGGQNLSTPLLMPRSKYYEGVDSCVKLMTHSGSIISIPHDLRVPFARYVAWNDISLLRRYSVERVYRERKTFGFHPRELYECAFDIVTPSPGNFMADAEILYVVYKIIDALPGLKNKNFLIRLNHTSLLKAYLLHCGIKEKHNDVYNILSDAKEGKVTTFQIKTHLISLGLSDNSIETFVKLIENESPLSKLVSTLQSITKKKSSEASSLAKQGLQELKTIIQNTEALGVTYNIVIAPGLVYNVQQYSGMMCQFVCELKNKKRKGGMEVLAAGGRYDAMIASYRNIKDHATMSNKDIRQAAVGISISLDKLVQAVQEEGHEINKKKCLDAVVCGLGSKTLLKEKARVVNDLWDAGISCCLIEASNLEEIQEQCTELHVPHVIMLKDNEQGTVRVQSWERDRFQEKTIVISELVDNMQRIIRSWNEGTLDQTVSSVTPILRTDNKVSNYEHIHEVSVTVLFITIEKLSANTRKRYENQIRSQMDNTFKKLNGDVMVLALSLESNVIRTLASYLDFENEQQHEKSVEAVIEKHQRHKKYLIEICDEIYDQKSKRTSPIVVLFSLVESFYKILL